MHDPIGDSAYLSMRFLLAAARKLESGVSTPPMNTWLRQRTPLAQPYPCVCAGRRNCSPTWCPCSGRVDLHNVPPSCCARNGNTPREAAKANHLYAAPGKSACWCNGEVQKHADVAVLPVHVAGVLTDPENEEDA